MRQMFHDAEAVLVLNPITAALLEPFACRVCIVPWGIDAARFRWARVSGQLSVVWKRRLRLTLTLVRLGRSLALPKTLWSRTGERLCLWRPLRVR